VAPLFGGTSFDLSGQLGHVVLLNFWASWCKPCRAEMPELARLQQQYHDRGLVVVGLSADDRHDLADARKAAQGLDYGLGMLCDAKVNGFGQPLGIPLTYLIGADGSIRAILRGNQGPFDAAALQAAVTGALDGDVR
jgi:thiol-disulfide isomerase/thioredoxin